MKSSGLNLFASLLIGLAAAPHSSAALYWDTNGTAPGVGGSGTFSSSQVVWNALADGTGALTAVSSPVANDLVFEGTAGTVTMGGSFTATSFAFNTPGYALTTTSGTRTLTGPITLAAGVNLSLTNLTDLVDPVNYSLTLAGVIGGTSTSGITVTGVSPSENTVVLSGLSTFGGGTTVSGGTLKIGSSSTFVSSAVTAGPIGVGSLTLANGVAVDPGATNRVLGASTFFVNGNVNIGNAATSARLTLDGAIDLGGGVRTLTLFRNGTATNQFISGNEAFKLLQQGTASTPATFGPAITLANGTLRLVSDASVTTTYTLAKFDILTGGSPITCTANSGLTIGDRVIAAFGSSNVFGTGTDVGPKLTVESGGYYNMNDGGTGTQSSSVFSLAGGGTVTSLDTNGGTATLTITGSDTTTFSGSITDGVNLNATLGTVAAANSFTALTQAGSGTLILSGTNTYAGLTKISSGTLQVNGPSALSSASTLNSGGSTSDTTVLNLATASAAYTMGALSIGGIMRFTGPVSGSSTLTFTGNAAQGFTGAAAEKKINVATGVNVVVSDASALGFELLGSAATVDRSHTIQVDGALTFNAALLATAPIALPTLKAGFTKTGAGVLTLNAANTYTGPTFAGGGILRLGNALALPGGIAAAGGTSAMVLSGGAIIGLTTASGDFTRNISAAAFDFDDLTPAIPALPATDVGWVTGETGGFAAFGGNRNVNFGGSGASVSWSSGSGRFGGGLILGHSTSDSTITVVNSISIGSSAVRTFIVNDGSAAVDAILSGVVTGSVGATFVKDGAGTLALNGVNTYLSDTQVLAGVLAVNGTSIADANKLIIDGGKVDLTGAETVNSLFFGAAPQAAGTYSATGAGGTIASANFTGTGTLIVTSSGGSPYTTWAAGYSPADLTNTAGDNDNDGLTNQQEFAFGLNPVSASSVNPIVTQLNKTSGQFSYQRLAGSGLTYKILKSTTLAAGSWTEDTGATQAAGAVVGGNQTVVVTLSGAPLGATSLFVRVAAQ